jgi:hypothetical protein
MNAGLRLLALDCHQLGGAAPPLFDVQRLVRVAQPSLVEDLNVIQPVGIGRL